MAKVKNLINYNGNPAANQFVITTDKGVFFQSYNSVIAFLDYATKKLKVTPLWDYSNTTRKHFYIFLDEYANIYCHKKEFLNMIKTGQVEVVKDGSLNF